MKGRRAVYAAALAVLMINSAFGVLPAFLFGRLVDEVLIDGRHEKLFTYAAVIVSVALLRAFARYFSFVSVEKTSQTFLFNLRRILYDKLQKLDNSFFSLNPVGDIIAQMTGDLDLTRHTLSWIIPMSAESLGFIAMGFVMLFITHLTLTLILFLFIPFIILINFRLFAKMKPYYAEHRAAFQAMDRTVQENIGANRVVKAFAREDYEINRLREKSAAYRDCSIRNTDKWMSYSVPVNILVNLMAIAVLGIGSVFVVRGDLSVGSLSMFTGLVWGLSGPLRLTGNIANDTRRALVSIGKISGIYYAWSDIREADNPVNPKDINGEVSFQNVSLKLSGKMVLKDISFKVSPGETLAIMGPTGAGKTLLVSLLLRFYDPCGGRVFMDGAPIDEMSLDTLRKSIGISMQDVFLFSDTIDGNIAYSDPEMPEGQVRAFADAAACEFITKMPEGYNTIIGERGVGLSGGQRQRIALARAIARKAPVLILDDTTSAVDMETEKTILDSLEKINTTKIIVAQRISSVKHADHIIVLENGSIAERGTHETLKNAGGWYSRVLRIQEGFEGKVGLYG